MLGTQLLERLKGVPGFDTAFLQNEGATTITQVPNFIKPLVISAYNEALRDVFRVGLIMACLDCIRDIGDGMAECEERRKRRRTLR